MKTIKYIKPEITVIEIEGQQILAGSGGWELMLAILLLMQISLH